VIILRSYAEYFKCETLADVPIRIDYENLQRLLLNAFLSSWLKQYMDYSLNVEHIVSVRLMKGKNGIHLDNRDHAILEHCLSPDGTKLSTTMLDIMLLIDAEHLKKARVHRNITNAQLEDQQMVCFPLIVSVSSLTFSAV
jgi:hypothetical protein